MVFYSLDSPVAIIVGIVSLVLTIWALVVSLEVYGAAKAAREFFDRENHKSRFVSQDTSQYDPVGPAHRERQRSEVNLYRDR